MFETYISKAFEYQRLLTNLRKGAEGICFNDIKH